MTPPAPARLSTAGHTGIGDWMRMQPPSPLPRIVTPMPYEAIHHYLRRLAGANHQTVGQISHLIRVLSPDPSGRPEEYGDGLRPACRRCAARYGLFSPVPCKFPDHQMICRHHQLWIGPGVWQPADQHNLAPFPEMLRAQRHHDRLLRQHPPETLRGAFQHAGHAWRQHLGPRPRWTPSQFYRFTALTSTSQRTPCPWQGSARPPYLRDLATTIAIYPDVVQLAALLLDPHHPRQCWPSVPEAYLVARPEHNKSLKAQVKILI